MYKQLEYLREGVTGTLGQTFRIDLPETGLLTAMFLKVSANATSGAFAALDAWRLQDYLTTLEVIGNGATVIKSADFKHFDFLNWLRNKVNPLHAWRNYGANTQFEYVPILFGRSLYDKDYGLDLSKWDNVEFRLTNSSSATYHSTDLTISLLLAYWREHSGGFRGYLRTEKWREWTTVSDEWKYFTLPTEFPISGVYLRALPDFTTGVPDSNGANGMYDIDFSKAGGTKRLFVGGLDDLALMNYYELGGSLIVPGQPYINADQGVQWSMLRSLGWATATTTKDGAVATTFPTMASDLTDGSMKYEDYEADRPIATLVQGYGYQHMGWLWHSQDCNSEDLLDPAEAGEVRLNIHTRSGAAYADGTNQVVLERVVNR
jgi:hypothetical protein